MDATPDPASGAPAPVDAQAAAERDLRQAAIAGRVAQPADLRASFDDPHTWVSAEVLRQLVTERDPAVRLHERGVRLRHLRVVGDLDLAGCEVRRSLRFEDCLLDGVSLGGAKLALLSFDGGSVEAIFGDRMSAAALFLRGVEVRAGARFLGAQVAGDIDCSGARISAEDAGVSPADGAFIARNAALGLDGASVGGAFFLRGAQLRGSLVAASLAVAKVLDARGLVVHTGQVQLHSANVGGDLDLGGVALVDEAGFAPAPHGYSVVLTQARVAGSLFLKDGFSTDRVVILNDARVGGNLSLRGAHLAPQGPFSIVAQRLQVEGAFHVDSTTCFGPEAVAAAVAAARKGKTVKTQRLGPRRHREDAPLRVAGAALDLSAASAGSLSDQWADWPRGNRVLGFRYKAIVGATSTRARWWTHWLKLQVDEDLRELEDASDDVISDGFKPQPWDLAILALRAAGCQRDAEALAIAKETAEHAHDTRWFQPLHRLWGVCAGYGYRPLRLLWAMPVVYAISAGVYQEAADAGAMAPTKEEFIAKPEYQRCRPEHGGNWTRCALAPAYPDFNAWAYAGQLLLPAIELRQAKDWAPVQWARTVQPVAKAASGASAAQAEAQPMPPVSGWGRAALYWSWFETTLGLVAPVLVGLALAGLIRRQLKD